MSQINDVYYSVEPYIGDILCHYKTAGAKWGYTNGKPNGKRKAGEKLHNGIPDGESKKGLNGAPIQTQSNATYKQKQRTNIKGLDDFAGVMGKNYKEYDVMKKQGDFNIKNFLEDSKSNLKYPEIERAYKALIDYRRTNIEKEKKI